MFSQSSVILWSPIYDTVVSTPNHITKFKSLSFGHWPLVHWTLIHWKPCIVGIVGVSKPCGNIVGLIVRLNDDMQMQTKFSWFQRKKYLHFDINYKSIFVWFIWGVRECHSAKTEIHSTDNVVFAKIRFDIRTADGCVCWNPLIYKLEIWNITDINHQCFSSESNV